MSGKKARKTRASKAPAPVTPGQRARAKPPEAKVAAGKGAKRKLSPLEVQLRKALAEMGLARARRVFAAVEASFDD
jgi:hypothetical protein